METLKHLLTSLVLLFSSFFHSAPVKDVQVAQPVMVAVQEQENSALVYKNPRLGFSVTFPQSWAGYRYKEGSTTVSFGIKDQEDVFLMVVYTKKEWADIEDEFKNGGPMPTKLKENEKYVYSYSLSQDSTDSAFVHRKDITSILNSLKLN